MQKPLVGPLELQAAATQLPATRWWRWRGVQRAICGLATGANGCGDRTRNFTTAAGRRGSREVYGSGADLRDYKVALARTRQAVHTHNAIVFMNAGNPARALVELKRALYENQLVREPLLTAQLERQDLMGLYRLHLLNSEVPPDFATLLQLRELFALSDDEAERLEKELMGSGSLFSI